MVQAAAGLQAVVRLGCAQAAVGIRHLRVTPAFGAARSLGLGVSNGNRLSHLGHDDVVVFHLGNPAGVVINAAGEKTFFHMGDTGIFSDMALINEIYQPKIGIVPIGDRFTMGAKTAALACKRFFEFETVIPCHYRTFPIIDQTADKFVAEMGGNTVVVPKVGVPFAV